MALGSSTLAVEPLGGKGVTSGGAGSFSGGAILAATDTITTAGVVGVSGAVAFTATATVTASGFVGTSSGSSLAATVTVTTAGVDGKTSGATLSATATITAAGSPASVIGASVAAGAAVIAAGRVGLASDASLAATVTISGVGHAQVAFRDVVVGTIDDLSQKIQPLDLSQTIEPADLSQTITPADLSQSIKPVDVSRVVVVSLVPTGGSMKLPPEGREWYVIKFPTTPQVSSLSASFDGEVTWVAGQLVSGTSDTFRWLVAGPNFNASDPSVTVATYTSIAADGVTPMLRSYDTPEVLQRKGKTITVTQS